MKEHLQMDWIDGILIALGFFVGIQLAYLLPNLSEFASEISFGTIFLAPALRRLIFGPPVLGVPKEGALWQFCSVLGLFTVFLSVPVLGMGTMAIQQSKESTPDFRSEVLKEQAELDERLREVDSFLNAVVVPAGTPQEEIDRLTAEKKKQREIEKRQKIEGEIQARESDFSQRKEERFQEGVQVFLWGLGVCFLGSLLIRLRYPFARS